jgi:hypothetical protein
MLWAGLGVWPQVGTHIPFKSLTPGVWSLDLVLRFWLQDIKEVIHILNIYGPYQSRKPFWDSLLTKSFFKELLILGGDLNLSLGPSEVWGDNARPNPLADFFSQKFVECRLTDLDPICSSLPGKITG